eukprot:SAG31_NODE_2152_length_6315_cov_6.487452_3_plen_43_part_00
MVCGCWFKQVMDVDLSLRIVQLTILESISKVAAHHLQLKSMH